MRSLRILVATVAAVCGIAASSYAWTQVGTPTTFTAAVTITGNGVTQASCRLSDNSSTLKWNNVVLGSTNWAVASNYIVLSSTLTDARAGYTGGIQIYTDNRSGAFLNNVSTSTNLAGLVSDTTTIPVPMCWRIINITTTTAIVQGTDNELYSPDYGGQDSKYPCWMWMMDKSTKVNVAAGVKNDFANGDDYVTVKDAVRGIHHASGNNWLKTTSPDNIYVGANFGYALSGRTYNTTVRVELFTE